MSLIDDVYESRASAALAMPDGRLVSPPAGQVTLLSGSFNPLHDGHRGLLEAAERITGRSGWFEISIENVDKPDMPRVELDRRLEQFSGYRPVVVTRAPRFVDKARLLPGTTFAIGYDTFTRLFDDRYYGDVPDTAARGGPRWAVVIDQIRSFGCRFVVAGRKVGDRFISLDDSPVPPMYRDMFIAVPEKEFRADVSSTELRKRSNRDG